MTGLYEQLVVCGRRGEPVHVADDRLGERVAGLRVVDVPEVECGDELLVQCADRVREVGDASVYPLGLARTGRSDRHHHWAELEQQSELAPRARGRVERSTSIATDESDGHGQVLDRLGSSESRERVIGRALPLADRSQALACFGKVTREHLRFRFAAFGKRGFEDVGDAAVDLAAGREEHRRIRRILDQGMPEHMHGLESETVAIEQPGSLCALGRRRYTFGAPSDDARDQRLLEIAADRGACLHERHHFGETLKPREKQFVERRRNRECADPRRTGRLSIERASRGLHEVEGNAVCLFQDARDDVVGQSKLSAHCIDDSPTVVGVESFEPQALRRRALDPGGRDAFARSDEHERARAGELLPYGAKQLRRRRVDPVGVLDEQQHRLSLGGVQHPSGERRLDRRTLGLRRAGQRRPAWNRQHLGENREHLLGGGSRSADQLSDAALEFVQPQFVAIAGIDPGGLFDPADQWVPHRAAMLRRALKEDFDPLRVRNALPQFEAEPGLAHASFARDVHHTTLAGSRFGPGRGEGLEFGRSPEHRYQPGDAVGLEAGHGLGRPEHPARSNWSVDPFDASLVEKFEPKAVAKQSACRWADNDFAGACERLHPRSEIRRLADRCPSDDQFGSDDVADDDQTGGDPDPRRERSPVACTQRRDRCGAVDARPRCPLGVVLVRAWKSEVRQDAIAEVLSDRALVAFDGGAEGLLEVANRRAKILGVDARAQRGEVDEIREEYREHAALRLGGFGRVTDGSRTLGLR